MMYSKTLSALLLLAPAVLASPVVTDTPSSDIDDLDLGISNSDIAYINSFVNNIPTSIRSVLETAVPVSWYMNLVDPAVQSSVISKAEAGIYPDWYSALPSSVIAWASSVAQDDDFLFASATATDDDVSHTSSTATGNTVSATATATASASATATATQTESKSADNSKTVTGSQTEATTATSATDASGTASTAASSTASSATSTGGAPLATGGVAMSLAGAAGLLGLAVML